MRVEVELVNGEIAMRATGDPMLTIALLEMAKALTLKKLMEEKARLALHG